MRDAARIGHRDEQLKIDQVETHHVAPAFVRAEGCLNDPQIVPVTPIGQCIPMSEPLLILIAAAFLLAGFIKGVLGLGLPTVSMACLRCRCRRRRRLPSSSCRRSSPTSWQTFAGPYLRDIIRRLWPLMIGTVIGIWLNRGPC